MVGRCTILLALALAGCEQGATPAPAATQSPSPTTDAATATAPPSSSAAAPASAKPAPVCKPACHSIERCEENKCVPACPDGEVYVPATGDEGFMLGGGLRKNNIDKPHPVILTKPFCMDATEVTVKAYKACVKAGDCEEPRLWGMWRNYPTKDDHPLNKVNWKQATTYCAWRKQSLPSEAQWEWAATGGDGRKWAWGNEKPTCKRSDYTPAVLETPSSDDGCHGGGTSPVGSHPDGDRVWPDGRIHDLSGNVWEWCIDNYLPFPWKKETDPVHMNAPDGVHVVRGGGWNRSGRGIRAQYRGGAVVGYQVPGLGFRCVRNPT